jgi:hypothetical protein
MYHHIVDTHTFCLPAVRETARHGAHANRDVGAAVRLVLPQVTARPGGA